MMPKEFKETEVRVYNKSMCTDEKERSEIEHLNEDMQRYEH